MTDRFSAIPRDLPLALLPVRLEARFWRDEKLRVRVFPDQIHARAHSDEVTAREEKAGQAYWGRLWPEGSADEASRAEARAWLGARVGARRALHVAEATRPTNWGSGDKAPTFPALGPLRTTPPVAAGLLPDFWLWRLYDTGFNLIQQGRAQARVARGLNMAPSLAATVSGTGDPLDGFLRSQELLWMTDFEAAQKAGMGFEIALSQNLPRYGALMVAGVRQKRDPVDEAEALEVQFLNHWYSGGLDILPQGTPTNGTEAGPSPWTESLPDMDALFAQDETRRPIAAAARAAVLKPDPSLLLRLPATDAAAVALGLTFDSVLDRVPQAEALDGLGGWVMQGCVGPGLGEYFTQSMMTYWGGAGGPPLSGRFTEIMDHYMKWVRGAGPLPSLLVGPQPYGLLPMALRPEGAKDDPVTEALIATLGELEREWRGAFPLPHLDPDATDGQPGSDPAQTVTALHEALGATPHPVNLHTRELARHIADDVETLAEILDELDRISNLDQVPLQAFLPAFVFFRDLWAPFRVRFEGDGATPAPDIDGQMAVLADAEQLIADYGPGSIGDQMEEVVATRLRPLLEMYRDATDAVPDVLQPWNRRGGLSHPEPKVLKPDPLMNFVGATYDLDPVPIGTTVSLGGSLNSLAELLVKAIDALDNPAAVGKRDGLLEDAAPLLHVLIERTVLMVPAAEAPRVQTCLKLLQERLESVGETDAAPEFERLMRETLGLFMHRLDAWITSFAAKRLAELRAGAPRGISLGGYGWLVDLTRARTLVSDGYIHAASMNQATTAALLRSGWKGYGTEDGTAPLAVDLTSRRVRGAKWVLDALRNGQDIGETLGARFERSLHDDPLGLDAWIDEVRGVVNGSRGLPNPEGRLVDGLLIAGAYSAESTDEEAALRTSLDALTAPAGGQARRRRARRVRQLFVQIADDLDAVADLAMAEVVHSLAQGNASRAAAAMNLTGDAEGAVPEIAATRTPADAQLVTHRALILCDTPAKSPPAEALLDGIEPRLAQWVAGQLPDPAATVVTLRLRRGRRVRSTSTVPLSELGMTAAEMAVLAGRGASQAGSRLGRLLRNLAEAAFAGAPEGSTLEVDTAAAPAGQSSVDRFGLRAAAVMEAVQGRRAMAPADLAAPDSADPAAGAIDTAELQARLDTAVKALTEARAALNTDPDTARATAAHLAPLGLDGALALTTVPSDEPLRMALEAAIDARLAAAADTAEPPEARLFALAGGALPVLPLVTAADPAALAASAANVRRGAALADRGHDWWRMAARVEPALGRLADVLVLTEAADPSRLPDFGLAQLPDRDEDWGAIARPDTSADPGPRLCLFAADGGAALASGRPLSGLVLGAWTEGIPRPDHQTGLAFHFDSPSARAPQTVLLALLERDDRYGVEDQVFAQMLRTLELAKLRLVGPDRLATIGHYAPATYLPGETDIATEPAP